MVGWTLVIEGAGGRLGHLLYRLLMVGWDTLVIEGADGRLGHLL